MKKKFLIDVLLNIISTALPLMILQIFAMPVIAKQEGPESYGLIVVIISILTLISFPLGNVLNNIRLLKNNKCKESNSNADFAPILLGSSFYSIIFFITISLIFFENLSTWNIVLQVVIVLGLLIKDYWIVAYRINLNFKGILVNNILLALGYLVGLGLYYIIGYWEVIYLVGLVLSVVYILTTTEIWKEPLKFSSEFKSTFFDFLILYFSGILKNVLTYADKILLLPLLGPVNVAIYYSATIIGKLLSMIFGPINSVILSYLTKIDRITNKVFLKGFIMSLTVTVIGYFFTIIASPFILYALYPDWAKESLQLIYVTTAATYITILSSLFHPFNLRYNKLKWQIYMGVSNIIFYIFIAIVLTHLYALMGFAIAVLISKIYIFIFQLLVFILNKPLSSEKNGSFLLES